MFDRSILWLWALLYYGNKTLLNQTTLKRMRLFSDKTRWQGLPVRDLHPSTKLLSVCISVSQFN